MADHTTKPPAFPPNYVTIIHLQERWIKEQQLKLEDKEEELKPKPLQQEESKQLNLNQDDLSDFKSPKTASRSSRRRKNARPIVCVEAVAVVDETPSVDLEQNGEVLKKWKARAKKKVNQGNPNNENSQEVRNGGENEVGGEVRSKSKDAVMESEVSVIEPKLEKLSLGSRAGKGHNHKSKNNGGKRKDETLDDKRKIENIPMDRPRRQIFHRSTGGAKFGHGGVHRGCGAGYVWVRKEDVFRDNAGSIQRLDGSSAGL